MRKLFILLALLIGGQVSAQKAVREYKRNARDQLQAIKAMEEVRSEEALAPLPWDQIYNQFDQALERGKDAIKAGADVVLDPIEQVDFSAVLPQATQGDWGDEYMGLEDHYQEIKSRAARPIRVVIFDTGKPVHKQLNDIVDQVNGKNWTSSKDELDRHSHASHCSGIVGGADAESLRDPLADAGLLEIGWEKVLSDGGSGSFSWITEATLAENEISKQKIKEGYFVIYSYSLGGGTAMYQPLEDAFQAAADLGVIIVAAAGNNGQYVGYPGLSPKTQAIAALQRNGTEVERASYSSQGPEVWGSTPGSYIYSTMPGDAYAYKSGTSMATPYMARVIATLASINPKATAAEVMAHLEENGTDLPPTGVDEQTGWGWPQIDKLLQPIDSNPPPPDPDPDPDPDPEPPTDPEPEPNPVKPARDLTIYVGKYSVNWKPKNGELRPIYFNLTADVQSKTLAEITIDEALAGTRKHFRGRSYFLFEDADLYDAALYICLFYRVIEKETFAPMPVSITAWDDEGRTVTLDEQDLKKTRGIKSLFIRGRSAAGTDQQTLPDYQMDPY